MDKIRVLVVDDSPFSQKVIKGALDVPGFEVCGFAESGRDGIEKYRLLQPDAVTMDVTMPDMDGLACSREILAQWPEARIVMVSAMKDETLLVQGRAIGIGAFLQKPVKSPQLITAIKQACCLITEDEVFFDHYQEPFVTAMEANLNDVLPCRYNLEVVPKPDGKFTSQGLAIIMGITGKYQGRVILDISKSTAEAFAAMVFGKETTDEDDMLHSVAEFANIVSGHGLSRVNDLFASLDLRLTPPSILYGESISIVNPKLHSFVIHADTSIGRFVLSIGFVGGK